MTSLLLTSFVPLFIRHTRSFSTACCTVLVLVLVLVLVFVLLLVEWLCSNGVPLSPPWFDTPDHPLQPVAQFLLWYWYWFRFGIGGMILLLLSSFVPLFIRHTRSFSTACCTAWGLEFLVLVLVLASLLLIMVEWLRSYWVSLSHHWFDTPDHCTLQCATALQHTIGICIDVGVIGIITSICIGIGGMTLLHCFFLCPLLIWHTWSLHTAVCCRPIDICLLLVGW